MHDAQRMLAGGRQWIELAGSSAAIDRIGEPPERREVNRVSHVRERILRPAAQGRPVLFLRGREVPFPSENARERRVRL
jgi:hypothetical protein